MKMNKEDKYKDIGNMDVLLKECKAKHSLRLAQIREELKPIFKIYEEMLYQVYVSGEWKGYIKNENRQQQN